MAAPYPVTGSSLPILFGSKAASTTPASAPFTRIAVATATVTSPVARDSIRSEMTRSCPARMATK